MKRVFRETMPRPRQAVVMGSGSLWVEPVPLLAKAKGMFIFDLIDPETGEVTDSWTSPNIITRDAGILAARLFRDSTEPNPGVNNGLWGLAVGTGATGALLNPDAPQATQRMLNAEIERKAFSSTTFRNLDGIAVTIPTNIVDFTTTFSQSEAVGALNEMAVISPYEISGLPAHNINNGPADYDPTIDVSQLDLLANYLTFPVKSKGSNEILSITWRLTF